MATLGAYMFFTKTALPVLLFALVLLLVVEVTALLIWKWGCREMTVHIQYMP